MTTNTSYLVHYGIKGQKWGVRRYQNLDGSRTSAGLAHDREIYAEEVGKSSGSSSTSTSSSTSEHRGLTDSQKQTLKNVGKAALVVGSVAAAGYLYAKHKDQIDSTIASMGKSIVGNKLPTEITSSGRSFVQKAFDEAQLSSLKRAERREAINAVGKKVIGAAQGATDAIKGTASSAAKGAKQLASNTADSAKNAVSNAKESAGSAVSKAGKSISSTARKAASTASKAAANTAKDAEDKLTAYMVTRTMENAANRRLQAKQEKNRHKEEMARIKRGG